MTLVSYLYIPIYPFVYVIKLLLYLTSSLKVQKFISVQDKAHNKSHDLPNTRLSVDISTL
jgi:uncharacterized protein VirK/YbjX